VLDEPHQLLVGPAHDLAAARAVTPVELAGHRIWTPGAVTGTEWAAYCRDLAATFGLTIDAIGPNFGVEHLLDLVADSADLATLVGERTRLVWPGGHDLRRIPVRQPTPVYPHSLVWSSDNPHPALVVLRTHLGSVRPGADGPDDTWRPHRARGGGPPPRPGR
jgi:DNA-binding transcriptional LysR family regulator